jgi:hypothetical protein
MRTQLASPARGCGVLPAPAEIPKRLWGLLLGAKKQIDLFASAILFPGEDQRP